MRALLLVAVVACSHPKPWRPAPAARGITVVDDLAVRVEVDGTTSVMARAALDGSPPAFGVVRLPADDHDGARSPRVAIARARAWQALARELAADPARASEAVARGIAVLPPCASATGQGEAALAERLRCADHASEDIIIDKDLVVRREEGGIVSVTATVALDGQYAAGYVRLLTHTFEKAAAAWYLDDIARGRGWQMLGRSATDPEHAYAAYEQGVAATKLCGANDAIFARHQAEQQKAGGNVAEAAATLRDLLDDNLELCAIHHHAHAL